MRMGPPPPHSGGVEPCPFDDRLKIQTNRIMDENFNLTVNDRRHTVKTDPKRSLLSVLREDLNITGPKYGCGEGQCGACTVLIDGRRQHSCRLPVEAAAGKSILTIEGLSPGGKLHPVQEAFLAEDAFQCGFCAPGMIMSTVALIREKPKATDAEIHSMINSHICRCCGYPKILNAVKRAVAQT